MSGLEQLPVIQVNNKENQTTLWSLLIEVFACGIYIEGNIKKQIKYL